MGGIIIKPLIIALRLMFCLCGLSAFSVLVPALAWEPSPGHVEMPIWPGKVPSALPVKGPETTTTRENIIAGGHLVAATSTHFDRRLYPSVDVADKESCRPDFAVALYPGHLWIDRNKFELNPAVPVTSKTPPTFLLQAEDDKVDPVNHSLVYYQALKKAGVPVEMHLYP